MCNKVYCKNCAHGYSVFGKFQTSLELGTVTYNEPTGLDEFSFARDCCPRIENKNNDCKFYKRKWWKFWIKKCITK